MWQSIFSPICTTYPTYKAYLTFVAVDEESKPAAVSSLLIETEDERLKNEAAVMRRAKRLKKLEKIHSNKPPVFDKQ